MSKDLAVIEALNDEITIAIEGNSDLHCNVTTYYRNNDPASGELVDAWVSVYNGPVLMFTVGNAEQWDAIFEGFRSLFSGPSEATVIAMFIASEGDCIF